MANPKMLTLEGTNKTYKVYYKMTFGKGYFYQDSSVGVTEKKGNP